MAASFAALASSRPDSAEAAGRAGGKAAGVDGEWAQAGSAMLQAALIRSPDGIINHPLERRHFANQTQTQWAKRRTTRWTQHAHERANALLPPTSANLGYCYTQCTPNCLTRLTFTIA